MLPVPRGFEVVGEIDALRPVELDDLVDAVLVAIGLDEHRMRREREARRFQHEMIGHLLRGLQVFRQQRR